MVFLKCVFTYGSFLVLSIRFNVHRILCSYFSIHVGTTKPSVTIRISQHKSSYRLGQLDESAVGEHSFKEHLTGHNIKFDDILSITSNHFFPLKSSDSGIWKQFRHERPTAQQTMVSFALRSACQKKLASSLPQVMWYQLSSHRVSWNRLVKKKHDWIAGE